MFKSLILAAFFAVFIAEGALFAGGCCGTCGGEKKSCDMNNANCKAGDGQCPVETGASKKYKKGDKQLKMQKTCPIMGGKISKKEYVDARGQRIYVCCEGCKEKVKADPEAALQKLEEKDEYAESLQKACPITGAKINKSLYIEYKGRRLYACCKGCLVKIKAEPEKYAEMISANVAKADSDNKKQ